MKKHVQTVPFVLLAILGIQLLTGYFSHVNAQLPLPVPDHIVVVVMENHGYSQIIGSGDAPFIDELANDPQSALFIQSYGIEHPSQPNYLDLYSGCNQGVTDDDYPSGTPFTTDNLGRQLLDAGKTFVTYSEDLPYVGFNEQYYNDYARKHNPAANWMGEGPNQIPENTNQPYTAFPSGDFDLLPTVCYVIPNQANDMHNGEDPGRITTGDSWLEDNLGGYIEWAKANNSLFILTFDEDDNESDNHIATIFTGGMVKAGVYAETINHYNVLRTMEDMYTLTYSCNAADVSPIMNCWIDPVSGIAGKKFNTTEFQVFPNPANGVVTVDIPKAPDGIMLQLEIFDMFGKQVHSQQQVPGKKLQLDLSGYSPGIYFVRLSDGHSFFTKKLFVR